MTKQQPEKKGDIGKEAAMEAEVRAARERALVPLENRVKSFTEMLREKDVKTITMLFFLFYGIDTHAFFHFHL